MELVVSGRSTTSLTVGWDAPAVGGLTGYTVTLDGDDPPPAQTPAKGTRTATFTGLKAGSEYTVRVITKKEDELGAKVENTFYTGIYQ